MPSSLSLRCMLLRATNYEKIGTATEIPKGDINVLPRLSALLVKILESSLKFPIPISFRPFHCFIRATAVVRPKVLGNRGKNCLPFLAIGKHC